MICKQIICKYHYFLSLKCLFVYTELNGLKTSNGELMIQFDSNHKFTHS